MSPPIGKIAYIWYVNHRGEKSLWRIMPKEIVFRATVWHPTEQWLLYAHDLDKNEDRHFAMTGIRAWASEPLDDGY